MSVRSLNKVQLIGNLTRDPECRYTPSGTQVCSFGLATNREWANGNGEKQSSVEYHSLVVWSKLAGICQSFLHKGTKIYAEGRLQTRDWQGNDGVKRKTTEIVVENMIILSSRQGDAGASGNDMPPLPTSENPAVEPSETQETAEDLPTDDESDIPF